MSPAKPARSIALWTVGRRSFLIAVLSIVALCLGGRLPGSSPADAQGGAAELTIVKPVKDCAALTGADLGQAAGAPVHAQAALVETPKGEFCRVTGSVAPAIGFEVDLPTARWTQRFLQAGCGGLCGTINASIGNAGTCLPALDGQFAVAASDLGHQGRMGSPDEGAFAADPQRRIDFAYRGNHVTALVAKALIRAYYGQSPRYSYFSGCSDGGREALMEAQRYPGDFDGISTGDPAMLFQVQNSFYHAWTAAANTRADGTHILLAAKLPILHAAVIAHCDLLDGSRDGLLGDPRACLVDPAWVRCAPTNGDASQCLTADEWKVAAKLYAGPTDAAGHRFLPGGLQPGSEMQWFGFVPPTADGRRSGGPGGRPGNGPGNGMLAAMAQVVYRSPTQDDAVPSRFPFATGQFARVNELHPLNDATNTDLRGFAGRGGKLILYHGWSDSSIAPMISVAYYEAVRRQMGSAPVDRFLRLFMLPGVGHCGGGDGFAQIDTLSALIAWVEHGHAPAALTADKVAERSGGPDGMGPPGGPGRGPANGADGRSGPPDAPIMPERPGGAGDRRGPLGLRQPAPYAQPSRPTLASRPILPFPALARYTTGDPSAAASYRPEPGAPPGHTAPSWFGEALIGPANQHQYRVEEGKLAVIAE